MTFWKRLFGGKSPKTPPATIRQTEQPRTANAQPIPSPAARPARAQSSSPEDEAERLFQSGRQLFAQDKFQQAVQPLERAAELHPTSPEIHFTLGMTYGRVAAECAYDEEKSLSWAKKSRTSFQSALKHSSVHGGLDAKQIAVARESITEYEKVLGLDLRGEAIARAGDYTSATSADSHTLAGVMAQPWRGLLARLVYVYFRSGDQAHTDEVYHSAIRSAEQEISNAVVVQGVLGAGSQTTDAVGIVFPECSLRLTDWFSDFMAKQVSGGIGQKGGLVRLPIEWFDQNPNDQCQTQQLSFSVKQFRVIGDLVAPL